MSSINTQIRIAMFMLFVSTLSFSVSAQTPACLGVTTTFDSTGTVQTWVVPPFTTKIRIVATGASGGQGDDNGGLGAVVETVMPVTAGQVLSILVGGRGGNGTTQGAGVTRRPGGGGGGSFVWEGASNLLVAAAGGGGGGRDAILGVSNAGNNGGINLVTMMPTAPIMSGGVGGMLGGGGGNGGLAGGAGGAGFNNSGMNGLITMPAVSPFGGQAIILGGAGGAGFFEAIAARRGGNGGYGGGGGGGFDGGGGGGGYNGGGGGASTAALTNPPFTRHGGGGGGSFVAPAAEEPIATVALVAGNGSVAITCVAPIPTMDQWGIMILLLLLSIVGLVAIRKGAISKSVSI